MGGLGPAKEETGSSERVPVTLALIIPFFVV